MSTDDVHMIPVKTVEEVRNGPPGTFCIIVRRCECHQMKYRYIHLKDPVGAYAALPLNPRPSCMPRSAAWDWNKDPIRPTLEPSILNHGNHVHPEWHGFVQDGVMTVKKKIPPTTNKEDRVGTFCANWDAFRAGPPGSFYFAKRDNPAVISPPQDGSIQGLWFKAWWPEPPGRTHAGNKDMENLHFLPFYPGSQDHWNWDGNLQSPTLTPSIRVTWPYVKAPNAVTVWHGYLQKGVFKNCEK